MVIPPHFVAYLQKHKIYELFYDMTSQLAVNVPHDHILFLRNYIAEFGQFRDKQKIMIIGPPHIDKKGLATAIGENLKLKVISISDFSNVDRRCRESSKSLVDKFCSYLHNNHMQAHGWILHDFPRARDDLTEMEKVGIFPTHAFLLLPTPTNCSPDDLWHKNLMDWTEDNLKKAMYDYKRKLIGLRYTLKNQIKEVPIRGRTLEQIAQALVFLSKQFNQPGGPMLPRVVLIGTRGSFRKTIACSLTEKYGCIHIDMSSIIERAKQQQNKMGENIRELLSKNVAIYGKYILALIEDRILDYDCLNRGWVMTGFPRNKRDLEALYMMDTPPNRVIFLMGDKQECLNRHKNRRVNIITGEVKSLDEINALGNDAYARQFVLHPNDKEETIIAEQEQFDNNIAEMLDFCGDNCSIIDGIGDPTQIFERVCLAIVNSKAIAKTKKPRTEEEVHQDLIRGKVDTGAEKEKEEVQNNPNAQDSFVPCKSLFPDCVADEWRMIDQGNKSYYITHT